MVREGTPGKNHAAGTGPGPEEGAGDFKKKGQLGAEDGTKSGKPGNLE